LGLLGISETTLMWTKAGTLFFFLGFFLVVLVRVLSRTEQCYEKDASIVLHDDQVIEPRKEARHE